MNSVIRHGSTVHPRLGVQEVLKLAVDIIYDGLPAGEMEERDQRGILEKVKTCDYRHFVPIAVVHRISKTWRVHDG